MNDHLIPPAELERFFANHLGSASNKTIRFYVLLSIIGLPQEIVTKSFEEYASLPEDKKAFRISRSGFESRTDEFDYEVEIERKA